MLMLTLTPQMRVLVALDPVDFRKGIDGMARICRQHLKSDPFSGTVFVFCNRNRTSIKILLYDSQGYWLCQKRLSAGSFKHWPKGDEPASTLLAAELGILLQNGDPSGAKIAPPWRKIAN